MRYKISFLAATLLCGCATASRTTLNQYRWAPECFKVTFPSDGWRFVNSLTGPGEHHELYERRSLLCLHHDEQISATSYLPTQIGAEQASPEEVFTNVTTFLSQSYSLSVIIVERANDFITWEWSGISKNKASSQCGVEKVVKGTRGLYRLRYVRGSASLSPKQKRVWISAIKDARLVQSPTSPGL